MAPTHTEGSAPKLPLSITPNVLRFIPGTACTRHIVLSCDEHEVGSSVGTPHYAVAFKLQTNAPKRYNVRPVHGIVRRGDSKGVAIQMRAEKGKPSDKFLVRCVWVGVALAETLENDSDGSNPLWKLVHDEGAAKKVIKCELVDSFETDPGPEHLEANKDAGSRGTPKSVNAIKLEALLAKAGRGADVLALLVKNFSKAPKDKLGQSDIDKLVAVKAAVDVPTWKKIQQYAKRLYKETKPVVERLAATTDKPESKSGEATPLSGNIIEQPSDDCISKAASLPQERGTQSPSELLSTGTSHLANGNFKLALVDLKAAVDSTFEGTSGDSPDFGMLAVRQTAFAKIGEAYEAVRDFRRAISAQLSCLAAQRFDNVMKRGETCENIARLHGQLEMHAKAVAWYEKHLDFSQASGGNMNEEIANTIDNHFRLGHLDEPRISKARIVVEYALKCAMDGDECPVYSTENEAMQITKVTSRFDVDMKWEAAPKGTDRSYLRRWPSMNGAATAPQQRNKSRRNLLSGNNSQRYTTLRKVRKGAHFLAPTVSSVASTTKKSVPKPRVPAVPASILPTRRVNSNANFLRPTTATLAYANANVHRVPPPPPAKPKPCSPKLKSAHDIQAREAEAVEKFKNRCQAARNKQDRLRGIDRRMFVASKTFKRRTTSVEHLETSVAPNWATMSPLPLPTGKGGICMVLPNQQEFTVPVSLQDFAQISVARIKEAVFEILSPHCAKLDLGSIALRISGVELVDSWKGADFGLSRDTRIELDLGTSIQEVRVKKVSKDTSASPSPLQRAEHVHDAAAAALDASMTLSKSSGYPCRGSIARLVRCLKKLKNASSDLALDLSTQVYACESEALCFARDAVESALVDFEAHCAYADGASFRLREDPNNTHSPVIDSGALQLEQRAWADGVNDTLEEKISELKDELQRTIADRNSVLAKLEGAKMEIKQSLRKAGENTAALRSLGGKKLKEVQQGVGAASRALGSLRDSVSAGFSALAEDIAHASGVLAARTRKPTVMLCDSLPSNPRKRRSAFSSSIIIAPKWTAACGQGINSVAMEQVMSYASSNRVHITGPHEAKLEGVDAPFAFSSVFGPDDVSQPHLLTAMISEMSRDALRGKAGYVIIGGGATAKKRAIFEGSNVKVGVGNVDRDGVSIRVVRDLLERGEGAEFVVTLLSSFSKMIDLQSKILLRPEELETDSAGRAFVKHAVSVRVHSAKISAGYCSRIGAGKDENLVKIVTIDKVLHVCTSPGKETVCTRQAIFHRTSSSRLTRARKLEGNFTCPREHGIRCGDNFWRLSPPVPSEAS